MLAERLVGVRTGRRRVQPPVAGPLLVMGCALVERGGPKVGLLRFREQRAAHTETLLPTGVPGAFVHAKTLAERTGRVQAVNPTETSKAKRPRRR